MTGYEPEVWNVVFNREGASGWARWVPGRFKHVRAYAFVPKTRTWLFYDVSFAGCRIFAIPEGEDAMAALYSFIGPAGVSEIVAVRRRPRVRLIPLTNWCTVALRHLLGLPGGALRPDAFYRECLANGGVPFEATHGCTTVPAAPAGPDGHGAECQGAV